MLQREWGGKGGGHTDLTNLAQILVDFHHSRLPRIRRSPHGGPVPPRGSLRSREELRCTRIRHGSQAETRDADPRPTERHPDHEVVG